MREFPSGQDTGADEQDTFATFVHRRSVAFSLFVRYNIEGREHSSVDLIIRRTSTQHLKTVTFAMDGREYTAIEQNPEKPSRWGQLAREGHRVVQFKDLETNRFVAVAVDGEVRVYGDRRSR